MSTANIADVDRHKTAVEHLQKQISLIRDPDIAAKFRASFDALQPRSAAALERVREQAASLDKATAAVAQEISAEENRKAEESARQQAAKLKAERRLAELTSQVSEREKALQGAIGGLNAIETDFRPLIDGVFNSILAEAEARGIKVGGTLLQKRA